MARPKDPDLRGRVLDAAAQEFSDRGYAGASVATIGERAGVTKGGVYLHFRSKEELFFAVVDQWRSGLRAALQPRGGEAATGADLLRSFVAEFLHYHFDHARSAGVLRVLATELRGHFTAEMRDDLRSAMRALRSRIRELLIQGSHDGTLFAHDPAFAAFLMVAAVEGVVQQWLAARRDAEPFCHAESLAEALIAPYATTIGPPAAAGGGGAAEEGGEEVQPVF